MCIGTATRNTVVRASEHVLVRNRNINESQSMMIENATSVSSPLRIFFDQSHSVYFVQLHISALLRLALARGAHDFK